MDFVKNAMSGGGNNKGENTEGGGGGGGGGGFLGGIGDKMNSAAGGGKESEKNEDLLDKGVYALLSLSPSPPSQCDTICKSKPIALSISSTIWYDFCICSGRMT